MLGLVNPKSVTSRYHTRNNTEVLSPLQVAEHNHVGADPHYCALTNNLQVTLLFHMGYTTSATYCTSVLYIPCAEPAMHLTAHLVHVTLQHAISAQCCVMLVVGVPV